MKEKILGVTLARGGSKAIPRKNIVEVNSQPLITYTIKEALKSKKLDSYIVSTDDLEIARIAESSGAWVPFLRPDDLSDDRATSADALLHAVEYLENSQGLKYDYVVELMATNPLKVVGDIDACIDLALQNEADSVVAVREVGDSHPARVKFIENGRLKPFVPEVPESRRQDLTPKAFIRCGSIYVTKVEFLKAHRARYSAENTFAHIMPASRVINIDEPIDLEVARLLLNENLVCIHLSRACQWSEKS